MTDVTDEQLDSFRDMWENHGRLIRDIVINYQEGRTNKATALALIQPYVIAIEALHASMNNTIRMMLKVGME